MARGGKGFPRSCQRNWRPEWGGGGGGGGGGVEGEKSKGVVGVRLLHHELSSLYVLTF